MLDLIRPDKTFNPMIMKNLLLTVILLVPILSYGQGDQTIITVPINAGGTSTFQAILHLPNDYGSTTTSYPLMMFFHGLGEGGANPASIYTSATAGGPAYFIAQGTFPTSFVNPKDGKSYKYIVVSPQANPQGVEGSTTAQELDYILTYLYAHYRVDTTRVYLTGLSDGGETVVEYPGGEMTNGGNFTRFQKTHHIAAIIPMSENASAALFQEEADSIVADNLYSWGFGSTDAQGQNTLQLAYYCNTIKAGTMITTSYSGGHCCWGQFYNPTFTQNGMNIYQWALQYTHGVSTPPATTPTANAGSAQTIQTTAGQVTLSGSASTVTNGTIAAYAWSQQSGPSTAKIATPTTVSTVVTGLTTAGVYVFALKITDNTGKTSTATVQITVVAPPTNVQTGAPVGPSIPGKIEAESYNSMSGVQTQTTTDTGGGSDVGWIDNGDWMNYLVNVTAAGVYTVSFRVAAQLAGATLLLKSDSGTVLATVAIPNTGGYQTWTTVSAVITLPAGSQTLVVYSASSINWNFNWMQFTAGNNGYQPVPGKIEAESYKTMTGVQTQTTTDTGGGLNVGWIDQGDWMNYTVDVAAAGSYTANFRVAAQNSGGTLLVKNGSGVILATVAVPATGGYQTWRTVSATVTLPAGTQTLQVYSSTAVNWNFNWMQFVANDDGYQPIPGTIAAETYSAMSGVQPQATTDTGGGMNVGWIDQGDWMNYTVDVAFTGSYTAQFRVAAQSAGGTLLVKNASGTVLATVAIPNTGGYQTWKTVSAVVALPAGAQTIQVYSSTAVNWNFNWMQFSSTTSDAAVEPPLTPDTAATFGMYPNPVQSNFTLNVSNANTGKVLVQIIDLSGVVRQVQTFDKEEPSMYINMSARDLPTGLYIVRVQMGRWSAVKKMLKQ